jgi:hypothetical protein
MTDRPFGTTTIPAEETDAEFVQQVQAMNARAGEPPSVELIGVTSGGGVIGECPFCKHMLHLELSEDEARKLFRAALAEAKEVAPVGEQTKDLLKTIFEDELKKYLKTHQLYPVAPAPLTLTDEQFIALGREFTWFNGAHPMTDFPGFARAVLAVAKG